MRKHPPFEFAPGYGFAGFCSGLILHSRLVCDPVHFPRLTTIFGERLFEVGGVLGHFRPDVANEDHSAVEGVLGEEFTASVLELADIGRAAQTSLFAVGPVQAPLAGFRVIKTKSQTFNMSSRAVAFEFLDLGFAIPELARDGGSVEFDPII